MKIAKLEPSKHKQGRWLVWLDDGSLVRLGEGDVVALSLYAGKELDPAEADALAAAAETGKLTQRAADLLAARPMSRRELTDKLRRKDGPPQEAVDQVADQLERWGLLNDREYAFTVVRHYQAKGFGPRKLRDELYRRGVPREFWDEALADLDDPSDSIDRLVARKLRGQEPTRENLKKVSDYLARRGFGWEEISAALGRCAEEEY
jgi:regulatory protein